MSKSTQSSASESFRALYAHLCEGRDHAAADVFARFSQRLVALARSRLNGKLQRKVDPEDIIQSVFRSFFRRTTHHGLQPGDWNDLWTILTVITVRKCANQAKYFGREKRKIDRDVSGCTESGVNWCWDCLDREPLPEEAALLSETIEQLIQKLSHRDRIIFRLYLQGLDDDSISSEAGCGRRTVRRVLQHIREHLQEAAVA